jgi:hypothetical protein
MIVLRQVRACYLQSYQEFPVVDCVCMPDCIDDSSLETEYANSHECWGVLVGLLTPRPGFKAAANGLFSILKDIKLRPRRRVKLLFYLLVHEYLSMFSRQNVRGYSGEASER